MTRAPDLFDAVPIPDLSGKPVVMGVDLSTGRDITMEAKFTGDGLARLSLAYTWDPALPAVAWLMNNPSVAGRDLGEGLPSFDPTARRVIHFSKSLGCGSARLVNWCPLVATDPADLWRMLKAGGYTPALIRENRHAIACAVDDVPHSILACGPEGMRRYPAEVWDAVRIFLSSPLRGLAFRTALCLGTTPGGAPLHPLARGKFAIPNDRKPYAYDLSAWEGLNDA